MQMNEIVWQKLTAIYEISMAEGLERERENKADGRYTKVKKYSCDMELHIYSQQFNT
jgi:hypothetical protein